MNIYENYSSKQMNDLCMIKHNLLLFKYESKILPHKLLQKIDSLNEKAVTLLKNNKYDNEIKFTSLESIKGLKKTIFTCFHTGFYKYIPKLLHDTDTPISLLMNKGDSENKYSVDKLLYSLKLEDKLNIVDINSRSEMVRLFRQLKNGTRNVLIYPDANLDANNNNNSDNETINFLNAEIYVKPGVSKLANKFNLNIVPIIALVNKNGIGLFNILTPINNYTSQSIMIDLWNRYEQVIKKYPYQWEGWSFDFKSKINRKFTFENKSKIIKFNNIIFTFWEKDKKYFLHNAIENAVYNLEKEFYDIFKLINENEISKEDIKEFIGNENYNYYIEKQLIY